MKIGKLSMSRVILLLLLTLPVSGCLMTSSLLQSSTRTRTFEFKSATASKEQIFVNYFVTNSGGSSSERYAGWDRKWFQASGTNHGVCAGIREFKWQMKRIELENIPVVAKSAEANDLTDSIVIIQPAKGIDTINLRLLTAQGNTNYLTLRYPEPRIYHTIGGSALVPIAFVADIATFPIEAFIFIRMQREEWSHGP